MVSSLLEESLMVLTANGSSSANETRPCDIYGYTPSLGLSIAATIAWGLLSMIILIQTIVTRKQFFLIVPFAGFAECLGYILRIPSGDNPCVLGLYIISYLLILVSPTCLVMGNYTLIGMVMVRTGAMPLSLSPRRIRNLFLSFDIACLFLQCAAGGLLAQASMASAGTDLMILAISAVLFLFLVFLSLTIFVHVQVIKLSIPGDWRSIFTAFYITIAFVITRCCYRVAEFSGGYRNSVSTDEPIFYIFDTLVLLCFLVSWIWFHPSRVDFEGPETKPVSQLNSVKPV